MPSKKVALCFLTYDNLSQPALWSNFAHATEKYNIYIHNKNPCTGEFRKYCIKNRIETKWGDITLVKATLRLFKAAFDVSENEYFVLLSDKCIPLYSPDEIYNSIGWLGNNVVSNYRLNSSRYDTLAKKHFFARYRFMKQNQWMILKRNTVGFFIKNDYTHIFGSNSAVPDEHYFINIMNKFNIGYVNRLITYVNWKEDSDSKKHNRLPKTYDILTDNAVKRILRSGCLFMRKVSKECVLPSYFESKFSNT